jgi:hypothetical protein
MQSFEKLHDYAETNIAAAVDKDESICLVAAGATDTTCYSFPLATRGE